MKVLCGCGKSLQVPDALVGKRVKCPHCGSSLAAEGVDGAAEGGSGGRAADGRRAAARQAEANRRKAILISGILGTVLLAVILAAVVAAIGAGRSKKAEPNGAEVSGSADNQHVNRDQGGFFGDVEPQTSKDYERKHGKKP